MSDKPNLKRRQTVKLALASAIGTAFGCSNQSSLNYRKNASKQLITPNEFHQDNWSSQHDRVWLGSEFWANPMEDWCIQNKQALCISEFGERNVHWITHQIEMPERGFSTQVTITAHNSHGFLGGAGFRLGVRSEIDDVRSHCFAATGIRAGIDNTAIFIGNKRHAYTLDTSLKQVTLKLSAVKQGQGVMLTLSAIHPVSQTTLVTMSKLEDSAALVGNIAIGANMLIEDQSDRDESVRSRGGRFGFSAWQLSGNGITFDETQRFGPILWAMYTVNYVPDTQVHEMAMTAILAPIGAKENQNVSLQIKQQGEWTTLATASIDTLSYTANFRLSNWDANQAKSYRLVYVLSDKQGRQTLDYYTGIIQADPKDERPLRMASLTCQNDYAFPYQPVVDNVLRYSPDIVYFSGDQIYETHGGFGIRRFPVRTATLNYLRKFYQFGWAFRETMRNTPTVCLPDDHDVLQGNLWGEAGEKIENLHRDPTASILGGYAEPVAVVNAIHRTCVSHLPAPAEPTPNRSGISVYYTTLCYGNVSFAILADRQWKSGPDSIGIVVGETGQDESPLSINPNIDRPGLQLLGERQERFLQEWGKDWKGHGLKAVLSQTVFAGIATHQPLPNRYLKYDFDSSGWPASARNRAVKIMRESKALHICGDTHLGTLSQYGVDKQRDSNWAFCSPAIAAGWPRWWLPDVLNFPYAHRPTHGHSNTGEYIDAFGNPIYVYAVANPDVGESQNRYVKAHEKGSGFGTVVFDTDAKTFTVCAYKFNVDISEDLEGSRYPGYPVTIHQDENMGQNRLS